MALHASGVIDPLIFAELPLAEAADAITSLSTRGTWGKVVLIP